MFAPETCAYRHVRTKTLVLFCGKEKEKTDGGCATHERGMTEPSGKGSLNLRNCEGERSSARKGSRKDVEVIKQEIKKHRKSGNKVKICLEPLVQAS